MVGHKLTIFWFQCKNTTNRPWCLVYICHGHCAITSIYDFPFRTIVHALLVATGNGVWVYIACDYRAFLWKWLTDWSEWIGTEIARKWWFRQLIISVDTTGANINEVKVLTCYALWRLIHNNIYRQDLSFTISL